MRSDIRILVVDDDPDVLFATCRIVQSEGYRVLKATTCGECMEAVEKDRPDLVLLDVVLPDGSGHEVCKRIKEDPERKDIFVIMISGERIDSDAQAEGLEGGADGYIVRPISNRELKARINAWVRILVAERERDRLILELEEALSNVKKLSGLLPICSHCKSIRDDQGYWNRIEAYINEHSEAYFSHGICPACAKEHYADFELYDE